MLFVELDGTLYFFVRCKNSSGTPTAPTGSATYSIYLGDASATTTDGTGTMTTFSTTRARASHSIAAANYTRGKTYTIDIDYTVGGVARSEQLYFTVT